MVCWNGGEGFDDCRIGDASANRRYIRERATHQENGRRMRRPYKVAAERVVGNMKAPRNHFDWANIVVDWERGVSGGAGGAGS